MRFSPKLFIALALIALPGVAEAHPSAVPHAHGFLDGIGHPLTGLDHLLAMVCVGLWASQKGGRALWLLPCAFVMAMIAGGAAGMQGVSLPLVEPAIAASLLVLGLMIAAVRALPLGFAAALVAVFGVFHGNAHGLEAGGVSLLYGAGFALSTITLHVLGLGLGGVRQPGARILVRSGALLIAAAGGAMLFT